MSHPLDRPVWSILTGRQAHLAVVRGRARRMDPAYGIFAATADFSDESLTDLAALVRAYGELALVEPAPPPSVPGTRVETEADCVQMVADTPVAGPPPGFEIVPLTDADAPEMLALATETRPGPFFSRTHQLGRFMGVRQDGSLIAMAGERMRVPGMTEVSGVCTLPQHRGRGLAAGLMRHVMAGIRARGEVPFLHAYASNTGAIGLYETLGFRLRQPVTMTVLAAQ